MSVTAQLRQLTPSEIRAIERDPSAAYSIVRKDLDGLADWGQTMMRKMEEINARFAEVLERRRGVIDLDELCEEDRQLLKKRQGEYARLHGQHFDTRGRPKLKSTSRRPRELDLDKAWHGLHFILTGAAEGGEPPLANAILGGRELPDRDRIMGYGPARYLTPDQVREVSMTLQQVSEKNLAPRFDLDLMRAADVYAINEPEDLQYLQFYFKKLKAYYKNAAAKGNGMLLYFT